MSPFWAFGSSKIHKLFDCSTTNRKDELVFQCPEMFSLYGWSVIGVWEGSVEKNNNNSTHKHDNWKLTNASLFNLLSSACLGSKTSTPDIPPRVGAERVLPDQLSGPSALRADTTAFFTTAFLRPCQGTLAWMWSLFFRPHPKCAPRRW
jgi:hypothetical protein